MTILIGGERGAEHGNPHAAQQLPVKLLLRNWFDRLHLNHAAAAVERAGNFHVLSFKALRLSLIVELEVSFGCVQDQLATAFRDAARKRTLSGRGSCRGGRTLRGK